MNEQTLDVETYGTVQLVTADARAVIGDQCDEVIIDMATHKAEHAGYRAIETPRIEWYKLTELDVFLKRAMLAEHGLADANWQPGDWLVFTRCRVVSRA